jgi:hypothetical protein
MVDSPHNPNTTLALKIIDEVFVELGDARWWENPLVAVTMDDLHFVQVKISNPSITVRSLTIRASDFGMTVAVMNWDEVFEWAVQDYPVQRAVIIDVLKTMLSEPMEVTHYGESLVVLRFYHDGVVRYKRRIVSGICISPSGRSAWNDGPIQALSRIC